MVTTEQDNHPHSEEQDEVKIQQILSNGEYELANANHFDDEALEHFLLSHLERAYQGHPIIIALTGAPASGKSTLVEHLITQLQSNGHTADAIRTDDFNRYHRQERNQKIAEGADPLQVKDFELLNKIVASVREGQAVKAPIYDEATGDAIIVAGEAPPYREDKFPHQIPAGLHYFFVEGDFQPVDAPDMSIYLHVPTDIRRENRVERDLAKRGGYGDAEAIRKSFDSRLQTQYYPYTLPNAEKSDLLIVAQAEKAENHTFTHKYAYELFTHKTTEQ